MRRQSLLSMTYIGLHVEVGRQFRKAGWRTPRRTKLDSACRLLPRFLIICWMAAAAVGLVVAARQPICVNKELRGELWKTGISCKLHRLVTAVGLLALFGHHQLFQRHSRR